MSTWRLELPQEFQFQDTSTWHRVLPVPGYFFHLRFPVLNLLLASLLDSCWRMGWLWSHWFGESPFKPDSLQEQTDGRPDSSFWPLQLWHPCKIGLIIFCQVSFPQVKLAAYAGIWILLSSMIKTYLGFNLSDMSTIIFQKSNMGSCMPGIYGNLHIQIAHVTTSVSRQI